MLSANNKKPLLVVLVLLLAIRFIFVPIIDWQQEQLSEIQSKSSRVEKATNVINRLPQIKTELVQLLKASGQQQTLFYNHRSSNTLKLQFQQDIETLFLKHKIKVINFSWVAEIENTISELRAKISYEGKTDDLAKLQLALAQHPKLINIAEWTMYIKKMDVKSLGNVSGTIVLTTFNIVPLTVTKKAVKNAL